MADPQQFAPASHGSSHIPATAPGSSEMQMGRLLVYNPKQNKRCCSEQSLQSWLCGSCVCPGKRSIMGSSTVLSLQSTWSFSCFSGICIFSAAFKFQLLYPETTDIQAHIIIQSICVCSQAAACVCLYDDKYVIINIILM